MLKLVELIQILDIGMIMLTGSKMISYHQMLLQLQFILMRHLLLVLILHTDQTVLPKLQFVIKVLRHWLET